MKKRKQNWNFNIETINAKPSLYSLILSNGMFVTKPEFISIMSRFFAMDDKKLDKYYEELVNFGQIAIACCTKDIAETKASELNAFMKDNSFKSSFFVMKL